MQMGSQGSSASGRIAGPTDFAAAFRVSRETLARLATYEGLLRRWQGAVNLVAPSTVHAIWHRHFADSAQLVALAPSPRTWVDLGSGAGFPGIPIKIWCPRLSVTLIESNQKKATFLREVCRATTLTYVNVVASRGEAYSAPLASTVTLRAVERFDSVLPIARRLLSPGGRLALLIGATQVDRARQSGADLAWSQPIPIPRSASRILFVGTAPWNKPC